VSKLTPITQLVAIARRRLALATAVVSGARAALFAGAALLGLVVVWKIGAGAVGVELHSSMMAIAAFALSLVAVAGTAALAAWKERRARTEDLAVASLLDVRLGLHDRLSTALAVESRTDPFAEAARVAGVAAAEDRRVRRALVGVIPVRAPERWWVGPALAIAAAGASLVIPQVEWASAAQPSANVERELDAARQASKAQVDAVRQAIEQNPELAKAMEKTGSTASTLAPTQDNQIRTPEDARREATRQVNELSKRLDEVLKSESAMQMDALKDALSRIDPAEGSPLEALAEALKRADAKAAKSALDDLKKLAEDSQMSEQARQELAQKLDDLASQLESASQARDGLKRALESAGMDGELAKNPDAARKAIDAAKGLNDAQKEALKKALAAQEAASKKLDQVAKACKSLGSQCKNPGNAKDGSAQACQSAGESLSDIEMLAEMLKDAESARSQCRNGQPSSKPSESSMNSQGGLGFGGERTKEETAVGTKMRKEKVAVKGGEVIARQLVDAPPLQGESRAKVERLSGEIGRGYEEGTDDDPVPQALREAHKQYFGGLKRVIDKKSSGGAPTPAASSPAPVPTPSSPPAP
jgi:hypothetical protein